MTTTVDTPSETPFQDGAQIYADAGWTGIIPLRPATKLPALKGVTGYDGVLTAPRWYVQASRDPRYATSNLGLRLPATYVGIDVDAYGDKPGAATLRDLETRLGPLPEAPFSTSRMPEDPVSRIRLFRIPEGTKFAGIVGPGIEAIQFHHRYAVVWPSVHPGTGRQYRWYGCEGLVPRPDEIPGLPQTWVDGLPKGADRSAGDGAHVEDFLAEHAGSRKPEMFDHVLGWFEGRRGDARHDTMLKCLGAAARDAAGGRYAAGPAFDTLESVWNAATDGENRSGEFQDMLAYAVAGVSQDDVDRVRFDDAKYSANRAKEPVRAEPEPDPELQLSDAHRAYLTGQAISDSVIDQVGAYTRESDKPNGSGIVFKWTKPDGTAAYQLKFDHPTKDADGERVLYQFAGGAKDLTCVFRDPEPEGTVLVSDQTLSILAALSNTPEGWGVVGLSAPDGFRGNDMSWAMGRDVVLLFGKSPFTDADTWYAADELKDALEAEGAESVRFSRLAGTKPGEGLGDVLGRRLEETRTPYLVQLAVKAKTTLGKRPSTLQSAYFDKRGGLLAETLSKAVMDKQPCALSHENKVAVYRDGVFVINGGGLNTAVRDMLREHYRPAHVSTAEGSIVGLMDAAGTRLPDRISAPLLNCSNGVLDLLTGELLPHDQKYLFKVKIPVEWDPSATCPHYEAWAEIQAGEQLDDLEEVTSTMLDQSRTPTKGPFLFGPARSGKGTWLRIAEAIAGSGNRSAITLHAMADDKFAAASIYGAMLNTAGDLSARDVQDVSLFKTLTGQDSVSAQRKHGHEFTFVSTALFMFSANEIPHVQETSNAYLNRVRPFKFAKSFIGDEDPRIEERILDELPGILVRWVKAWQRYNKRGKFLPTNPAVAKEFAESSDRVLLWINTYCQWAPDGNGTTLTDLYKAFKEQQVEDGATVMGKRTFTGKLKSIPGVDADTRFGSARQRGVNLVMRAPDPDQDGLGPRGVDLVRSETDPWA